ncbi:MAG: hypothetical protein OEX82_05630, partial [Nitrosomonas sp.]|nr:hypothetical protein [Nitrosomonas sp.]
MVLGIQRLRNDNHFKINVLRRVSEEENMISRRDFMKGIVQTTVAFAATTPSLLRAECIGREPIVQWLRGITLITTTDAFQVAKDSTMNLEVIVNFGS